MQLLFNLLLNPEHIYVALLAFIPGLINLGIFIYSYYFLPKSKLSVTFSLVVFAACIWQIGEGFLRLTNDLEHAKRIYTLMDMGCLLLVSSSLYFSLIFTKNITDKIKPFIITLIYLPSFFFITTYFLGWFPVELKYTSTLGFVVVTKHFLFTIESLFISAGGIICLFFLVKYWIQSKNNSERNKARLISIGYLIPFIQGLITELAFPELLNITPIPLTTTSITLFSITSIIALKKYNLLSYSPYKVTGNIVNMMYDAVIITDENHVIKYFNPSFIRMFEYEEKDLINRQVYFLLVDDSNIKLASVLGNKDKYEVIMKTKSGVNLNVMASSSPYYSNGKVMGSITILHDITKEKVKTMELTSAMIHGEERERNRLAKDLHDGIKQNMVVIKMHIQALKAQKHLNEQTLDNTLQLTSETIEEIRTISHNLTPLKENVLLCEAIEELINRFKSLNLKFEFTVTGNIPESINSSITINIYRALQEFINNSIKYSGTNLISINLNYTHHSIKLEINDNGCGFNYELVKNTSKGIGLQNMSQRIKLIGGDFNFSSKENLGTCLKIVVPF